MNKEIICEKSKSIERIILEDSTHISKIFKTNKTQKYLFKISESYWDELVIFAEKTGGEGIQRKMNEDEGTKIWKIN